MGGPSSSLFAELEGNWEMWNIVEDCETRLSSGGKRVHACCPELAAAVEEWAQAMWTGTWCRQIGYFSVQLTDGTGGC